MRQNQTIQAPIQGRDRRISLGIVLGDHGLHQGTERFGTATAPRIRNPPEPGFVLKQQPDGAGTFERLDDFGKFLGEFFFHSS
jgi:hypothetical protein